MPLDCGGLDGFSLSSFRHSLAFIRGIFGATHPDASGVLYNHVEFLMKISLEKAFFKLWNKTFSQS